MDDRNAWRQCRHDQHRRMDSAAQNWNQRHRSLFTRLDCAQRRTSRRHRRWGDVHGNERRCWTNARWPLRCRRQGCHPRCPILDTYDQKGQLVGNSLQRYGFPSQEIVRASDGAFELRIAARSRAGNWLPTGGLDRYMLMLRLYDTPVGVATRSQKDAPMPSIATMGCS